MPNKRISELDERFFLKSQQLQTNSQTQDFAENINTQDTYFLLAREKTKNEKINFPQLKSSILDSSLLSYGDQSCLGSKNFNSDSYFLSNTYLSQVSQNNIDDNSDETICFKYKTNINKKTFHINFPKRFKEKPVLSISTQCSSGLFIPYIIRSISNYNFTIEFASNIEEINFTIHIVAHSPSFITETGATIIDNQNASQAFSTKLPGGSKEYNIQFPRSSNTPPKISCCLEGSGSITLYNIYNLTQNGYTVSFSSELTEDYSIHTILQD